uniref:FPL domain-containing protein n=1 Tax=Rhabditophanes sp. KR3021 TaxID=114890 RepID=A0AC35U2H3_9BILA
MNSLVSCVSELKTRHGLLNFLGISERLLNDKAFEQWETQAFNIYRLIIEKVFQQSIRSFLTSSQVETQLYSLFDIYPRQSFTILCNYIARIEHAKEVPEFQVDCLLEAIQFLLRDEHKIHTLFSGMNDDESMKFYDFFFNAAVKVSNLIAKLKSKPEIITTLKRLKDVRNEIGSIMIHDQIEPLHRTTYFLYKLARLDGTKLPSVVESVMSHRTSNEKTVLFYDNMSSTQCEEILTILLNSNMQIDQITSYYTVTDPMTQARIIRMLDENLNSLVRRYVTNNKHRYMYRGVAVLAQLKPDSLLKMTLNTMKLLECQFGMPQLFPLDCLGITMALVMIAINRMSSEEKKEMEPVFRTLMVAIGPSLLSIDINRRHLILFFLQWLSNEVNISSTNKLFDLSEDNVEELQSIKKLVQLKESLKTGEFDKREDDSKLALSIVEHPDEVPFFDEEETKKENVKPVQVKCPDFGMFPSFAAYNVAPYKMAENRQIPLDSDDEDDENDESFSNIPYIEMCLEIIGENTCSIKFHGAILSLVKLLTRRAVGYKLASPLISEAFLFLNNHYNWKHFRSNQITIIGLTMEYSPELVPKFLDRIKTSNITSSQRMIILEAVMECFELMKKNEPTDYYVKVEYLVDSLIGLFSDMQQLKQFFESGDDTFKLYFKTIAAIFINAAHAPCIVDITSRIFRYMKAIRDLHVGMIDLECIVVYYALFKNIDAKVFKSHFTCELNDVYYWIGNINEISNHAIHIHQESYGNNVHKILGEHIRNEIATILNFFGST